VATDPNAPPEIIGDSTPEDTANALAAAFGPEDPANHGDNSAGVRHATQAALADGMVMVVAYRGTVEIGRAIVRPGDSVNIPLQRCNTSGECRQEVAIVPDESIVSTATTADLRRYLAILDQVTDSGDTTQPVYLTAGEDGSFDVVAQTANTLPALKDEANVIVPPPEAGTSVQPGPPSAVGCASTHDSRGYWHGCFARWPDNTSTHLGNYISVEGVGYPWYRHWYNATLMLGGQGYSISPGPHRAVWTADPRGTLSTGNCHTVTVGVQGLSDSFTLCPEKEDGYWTPSSHVVIWTGNTHDGRSTKGVSRFAHPLHQVSGFRFYVWVF
jgi:hypothetical protein